MALIPGTMIVPQFWAEARVHRPRAKGQTQITVRRFGWSDASQTEAEHMAQRRAREAFDLIVSGKKIRRLEHKRAYNGADGMPIREEVLARHGEVVITRNAYGAHCLNTPDVLFADIDFNGKSGCWTYFAVMVACVGAGLGAGAALGSRKLAFVLAFGFTFLTPVVVAGIEKAWRALRGGPERIARRKIDAWARTHPDWRLRVYRTPAGFRVLVMHAVFDPAGPEATAFFGALGVDPVYQRMCRNQKCFRARVSPKPWRIGISAHMKPRPGVWPVRPERMDGRNAWIREYEEKARGYASCRFVEKSGSGGVHAKAEAVRALHDEMARAATQLPIA